MEKELRKHQESLEFIVRERTEDLSKSNSVLVDEIIERKQAEEEREKLIVELQKALGACRNKYCTDRLKI